MVKVGKLAKHLSKNMLLYTLLIIAAGILVSTHYAVGFLSRYILVIVFLMIYPMMVNVSFESLKMVKEAHKPITIALIFNFILAPLLYWLLCDIFQVSQDIKVALILLAVAPASSMGLGYVGLSKGNMVSASVIVALAFVLSLVVYPITIRFLSLENQVIPFAEIVKSLLSVLVLPLVLGLITREGLIERKGIDFKKIKPIFSLVTLLFLYVLIFVIFALKGQLIIKHWSHVMAIAPVATLFYITMIAVALLFNKYVAKLDYEHNQAIVFTTVSKNVALTIGLLVTAFGNSGPVIAMYPAIISLFQIVFLMTYLHFNERIKAWW